MKTDYEAFANANSRVAFRRYVTRVAFQLTLSEPMIAALRYVRDDPGFNDGRADKNSVSWRLMDAVRSPISGGDLLVTEIRALERRGLTYHDEPKDKDGKTKWIAGHRYTKLTKIGELTCELLVESGLMPAADARKQRRSA